MTAELNEDIDNSEQTQNAASGADNTTAANTAEAEIILPPEINEIFEYLSLNQRIVFKSQQIDDPEMPQEEKVKIARDIYAKNRQTFLMRFGAHLQECHLEAFARLALSDDAAPLRAEEHCEEMQFMLKDYQSKLHTRKRDVKNRRYAALQQLVAKGEYFSEQEMMKRAPAQYQELVGQYLSEAEKRQRDGYDVKNTTFSGILMHSLEKQQLDDALKQAEALVEEERKKVEISHKMAADDVDDDDDGGGADSNDGSVNIESNESSQAATEVANAMLDENDEIPVSYRQQWGNFDNEQIACSSSRRLEKPKKKSIQPAAATKAKRKLKSAELTFITAGERNLLRQEFIGFMHEQFLAGNDEDFDYAQVDDNSQLDDLRQLDQDKEDAYFQESEDERGDDDDEEIRRSELRHNRMSEEAIESESEDELDIYMSHLQQHHSLRQ